MNIVLEMGQTLVTLNIPSTFREPNQLKSPWKPDLILKSFDLIGVNLCCKIEEAQITKIDCENILDLRKISKQTTGTKKINPKENRHKTPRITWFSNSLHPQATIKKFHYNKFGIIQIGVKALSQTQIPNTPK